MIRSCLLAAALAAIPPWATAQQVPDTDVYNGKWAVSLPRGSTQVHAANLVLSAFSGSWVDLSQGGMPKAAACKGKKFPVTVQVSQEAELAFTVWGSAVSPACPDLSVNLKPLDPKTLEGTIGSDQVVKLTRPGKAK